MAKSVSLHVSLGMVIDGDRMLFVHRNDPEIPEYDRRLELPGGKVESGESSARAACREVLEETGFRVRPVRQVPHSYYSEFPQKQPALKVKVDCWLCEPIPTAQDSLPIPAEQQGVWHSLHEIPFESVIAGSREFALWGVYSKLGSTSGRTSIYRADMESIDEARRRKRRYTLLLAYDPQQQSEPFTVARVWGGVHSSQRAEEERFRSMDSAIADLMDHLRKRRAHGYRLTNVHSTHPLRSWLAASGMPDGETMYPPLIPDSETTEQLQRLIREAPMSSPSRSSD